MNKYDNDSDAKLEYMLTQGYSLPIQKELLTELEKRRKLNNDLAKKEQGIMKRLTIWILIFTVLGVIVGIATFFKV